MSPTTAPTVHPVILLILDRFGYREPAADNAISLARKPTWDALWSNCPHNAMKIVATLKDTQTEEAIYYSIGGGFVVKDGEDNSTHKTVVLKYDVSNADELMQNCMRAGLNISALVRQNEQAWRKEEKTLQGILQIWNTMSECMYKGCHTVGLLTGGLHVTRRPATINKKLLSASEYANIEEWKQAI